MNLVRRIEGLLGPIDKVVRRLFHTIHEFFHRRFCALDRFLNAVFEHFEFLRNRGPRFQDRSHILADITSSLIHDTFSFMVWTVRIGTRWISEALVFALMRSANPVPPRAIPTRP